MNELMPYFGCALLGIVAHFLNTLKKLHSSGEIHVSASLYLRDNWASAGLSIIVGLMGVVAMAEFGQLTYTSAFAAAFLGDSLVDHMRARLLRFYAG